MQRLPHFISSYNNSACTSPVQSVAYLPSQNWAQVIRVAPMLAMSTRLAC